MMEVKQELKTRAEIETMVDKFYEKVKQDLLLAPVFAHLDWQKHLPIMYNFWSSMLLGDQSYQGNPFQKHIGLPIESRHFDQWLKLFIATVDENFVGDKAQEVKQRAQSIAGIFQHKLGITSSQ
jgi:hemoglobin